MPGIGPIDALITHPLRFVVSLVPAGLAFFLVALADMPVSFTGGVLPSPLLAFAAVYFWALVRPDLLPPALALWIGLAEDVLSGGPPGARAAGFIAAYAFIDRHRDSLAGLSGVGALLGFAAVLILSSVATYGLSGLLYLRLPAFSPLLLENVDTVLLYPLIVLVMSPIHRHVVGAQRES